MLISSPDSLVCTLHYKAAGYITCSCLADKNVKVNKNVHLSDTIKKDNLISCKQQWEKRFPDWEGPVFPVEAFYLQDEVGRRDAFAFLHFMQRHVAPEMTKKAKKR